MGNACTRRGDRRQKTRSPCVPVSGLDSSGRDSVIRYASDSMAPLTPILNPAVRAGFIAGLYRDICSVRGHLPGFCYNARG
jgi:hypothetical protein